MGEEGVAQVDFTHGNLKEGGTMGNGTWVRPRSARLRTGTEWVQFVHASGWVGGFL